MLFTIEAGQAALAEYEIGGQDAVELDASIFVRNGTASGQPTVLLVSGHDAGRRVVVQVTLNMLIALTGAMRSRAESEGWVQPP
jgi:hypothetical protein